MVVDSCDSFTYTFRVGVKRFLRDLKNPDFVFPVHPLLGISIQSKYLDWKDKIDSSNFTCPIKVSKSQNPFFLNLHSQKNEIFEKIPSFIG